MQKRNKRLVFGIGISQIFLLTLYSFAIAFILGENLVNARITSTPAGTASGILKSKPLIPYENLNPNVLWTSDPNTGEWMVGDKGSGFFNPEFPGFAEGASGTEYCAGFGPLGCLNLGTGPTAFFGAHLIEGVVWGGILALGIKFLGPMVGLSEEASNAAAIAALGGMVAGKALYGIIAPEGTGWIFGKAATTQTAGLWSFGVGALVAVAIFIATYKEEKKKLVNFQCFPYEPPLGGKKCEDCNKDSFRPCTEYRCKALGQACELLNPGTGEETCAWVSRNDAVSPTITPLTDALKPKGLSYVKDDAIRPPSIGVKIVRDGGACLQPFTPLEFGINLNEPAQCKVDYKMPKKMDEMEFYLGGSNYYRYNHTQKMKLPGPDSGTAGDLAPELLNDGTFSLFVRCRDANGNENVDAFVFNFCVDQSPDTTPPIIEGTNINNNGFVRFNADSVPIEVYVNEPAECKWSRKSGMDYDDMENSMECATKAYEINANLNYACIGNLTGMKNQEDNKFYFKCKDQPGKDESERNRMIQDYPLTLKGSQKLNIISAGPNGTIFGSTETVTIDLTVKTDDGAEEGKAICYFSNTGEKDSYIAMFESNSFEHKQSLDLTNGDYRYFFRCIDAGGNTAEADTSFSVFVDKQAPIITRAYKDEGLKIVTNEDAECVYSLLGCNYVFEEGLPMLYSNPSLRKNHYVEWKANTIYYIKCKDDYDNKPSPNVCNIVVNSIELEKNSA